MGHPLPGKLQAPCADKAYLRERLFSELDNLRLSHKAIWLAAPAGSGKTTLVSSYVQNRGIPVLWYKLEEGDADIASFFYYLGLAAQNLSPDMEPLPVLSPAYLPGLTTFSRNFFRKLFNHLSSPSVIVLDNYQNIPADSAIQGILPLILGEIPELVNLFVVSRCEPPPSFARVQLNGHVTVMGWDTLRVTEGETREIYLHLHGQEPSPDLLQALYQQSQGWLIGLIAMTKKTNGIIPSLLPGTGVSQLLFDYFAGEIFERLSQEMQDFLLRTAFMSVFGLESARAISGRDDASDILSRFIHQNYFISCNANDTGVTYEYHQLFRVYLRSTAARTFTSLEINGIKLQAARLMLANGQFIEAIALFKELGSWEELHAAVTRVAPIFAMQGRYELLELWLGDLPDCVTNQFAWLQYWRGMALMWKSPHCSEEIFEKAYHEFKNKQDVAGVFLAWSAVVDVIWLLQRNWKRLDTWIQYIEEDIKSYPQYPSVNIAARVVASMTWTLFWHRPDYAQLPHWIRQAEHYSNEIEDVALQIRLKSVLHAYYHVRGEYARARIAGTMLDAMAANKHVAKTDLFMMYVIRIYDPVVTGKYHEAIELTFTVLQQADEAGIHLLDASLCGSGLYGALGEADLAAADRLLEIMQRSVLAQQANLDTAHYHNHCSWRARLAGEYVTALEHAHMALELTEHVGALYPQFMCRYGLAHAYFMVGNHAAAEQENAWVREHAQTAGFTWWVFLADLLAAHMAISMHMDATAVTKLCAAFAMQSQHDLGFMLPHWRKEDLVSLYVKALEHHCLEEYVIQHIRSQHLDSALVPVHLENWPFPCKIYTLGRFSVVKNGETIRFTNKAQKKPLELLKALIAFGGRDVNENKLAEVLWPDADGDTARGALRTTLHRLRKLLGTEALIASEGKLSLDQRLVWVDVWALERRLTQMLNNIVTQTMTADIDSIFNLYHGAFLAEEDAAYALPLRERLRSKMLRGVEHLAQGLCAIKQCNAARLCYEKGLEIEPLVEHFYQGLMRCYQCLSQPAEVLRIYARCHRVLKSELGVEPCAETQALAEMARVNLPDMTTP